jgi:hypothetical protein
MVSEGTHFSGGQVQDLRVRSEIALCECAFLAIAMSAFGSGVDILSSLKICSLLTCIGHVRAVQRTTAQSPFEPFAAVH